MSQSSFSSFDLCQLEYTQLISTEREEDDISHHHRTEFDFTSFLTRIENKFAVYIDDVQLFFSVSSLEYNFEFLSSSFIEHLETLTQARHLIMRCKNENLFYASKTLVDLVKIYSQSEFIFVYDVYVSSITTWNDEMQWLNFRHINEFNITHTKKELIRRFYWECVSQRWICLVFYWQKFDWSQHQNKSTALVVQRDWWRNSFTHISTFDQEQISNHSNEEIQNRIFIFIKVRDIWWLAIHMICENINRWAHLKKECLQTNCDHSLQEHCYI